MNKNVKLLLTENVESLGIVGDVVNVRLGYARNFLLPRSLATQPSEEKIKALATKRADAEKMLAEQRHQREELSKKLIGVEVHLTRSCNDQGILYAAITQQDIASELNKMGHAVKPRDVRISQTIKRVDTYPIHIKLDTDLDAEIKLWVMADRKLDLDSHRESAGATSAPAERGEDHGEEKKGKGEKGEESEGKGEKSDKGGKHEKAAKTDKPGKDKAHKAEKEAPKEEKKGEWGARPVKADAKADAGKKEEKPAKSEKKDKKK